MALIYMLLHYNLVNVEAPLILKILNISKMKDHKKIRIVYSISNTSSKACTFKYGEYLKSSTGKYLEDLLCFKYEIITQNDTIRNPADSIWILPPYLPIKNKEIKTFIVKSGSSIMLKSTVNLNTFQFTSETFLLRIGIQKECTYTTKNNTMIWSEPLSFSF